MSRGRDFLTQFETSGHRRSELLVMNASNDPFNSGTASDFRDGEWFAGLWDRLGLHAGAHLRRVHYALLDLSVELPSGEPYENTEACWKYLMRSSKQARTLGLVDARLLSDRRNAPAIINWQARDVSPEALLFDPDWRIPMPLMAPPVLDPPDVMVSGYDWAPGDHPVQVELFIEKSTMNDVLVPLCEQLDVNLTVGTGYTSHTRIVELIDRAREHDRPVRVLCITDFDPAGHAMPTALARYLQFVEVMEDSTVDLAVQSIALTAEQCIDFELPRIPIKASDHRRGNFEARFGEGATELDALEARHPGALAQIVTEAVEAYRDTAHWVALRHTEDLAHDQLEEQVRDRAAGVLERLGDVSRTAAQAHRELIEATADAVDEYRSKVVPLLDDLEVLGVEYVDIITALDVELPARDVPQAPGLELDHDWLYRSDRPYLDQLARFRQHQRREVSR